MSAEEGKVLSGTAVSNEIQESLKVRVKEIANRIPGYKPGLAIVQVGGREDSNVYIRMKIKSAEEIGISAQHVKLPNTTTQIELLNKLKALNNDPMIHGIIVQMPLDSVNKIDSHLVTDAVSPDKDVDGLNTINEGRVAVGDMSGFIPCTPNGVMELIKRSDISIAGSNAVVLGRSKIVGTPVSELLKWANATVTVCHSRTKNLPEQVGKADILVVGIGQPEFVKGSWIKKGAVVIDCGINSVSDPTKKSGKKLVGDVAYDEAKMKASYITPVPRGVGPMTVAMLMNNTVLSAERAVDKLCSTIWSIECLPLTPKHPQPNDMEISRLQTPKEVSELAREIGVSPSEFVSYGPNKGKLKLSVIERLKNMASGNYVVVAGMTPTVLGEGKSTTTLGLVQALVAHKKRNAIACLRQPSQGPTFGIKGGAAGGGYSQVIPMDELNLHLTGDIHAVTAANNLLAALLDARIFHEKNSSTSFLFNRLTVDKTKFSDSQLKRLAKLGIDKTTPSSLTENEQERFSRLNVDPETISLERVIDTNDRYLRKITIGQSPTEEGHTRETSFSISVASEVMAVLALATDLKDLKERLGRIVVALDVNGQPVTAEDLGATGAMANLMKEAIEPTLMQTIEGTPVLIHAGPFANIAHGCSSIIADAIALKLVGAKGFTVTEAGFGTDIGMEKFFNIKTRVSGFKPKVVVLVCTVRALKMHGGGPVIASGRKLKDEYKTENLDLLKKGLPNLLKHIENGKKYGVTVVVAINAFSTDTNAEHEMIRAASLQGGAHSAVVCDHWAKGGQGALDLADAVINACEAESNFKFLYPNELSLAQKIETIAKEMYGAGKVVFKEKALNKMKHLEKLGFGKLPVCMAKTSASLSGDPEVKGCPKNFDLPVYDLSLSAGAGFIVATAGEISKMPGLPIRPAVVDMDLDVETGEILGLY
ncbi:C-1-tetrahydrofolate synthase, cytoplasmic [Cimex lectularius]|uniref:C-1-tetrahydrofolate synthase, cytoplasmic n=1 Tax=Cimex lectularius TaxID=79782 RepID=A0A8I6S368_CIMLE|nr:C-1-tetrahydrofolate synthase, cytoplasmic [Cimex lectularius]